MKRYSLVAYTFVVYSAILAGSTALTTTVSSSAAIATSTSNINSSATQKSANNPTSTPKSSNGLTPKVAPYDITQSVVTHPTIALATATDGSEKQMYAQSMIDRTVKFALPQAAHDSIRSGNLSVLHAKPNSYKNYPQGSELFPHHPELATQFASLIKNFTKNPEFIKFFRKIHLNALNELYDHLMKVYSNFNLQHVGTTTVNNQVIIDVQGYIEDEATAATSKKTLIINHLVNIIEAQFNGAIQAMVKGIPPLLATHVGKTLIQSDFSIDLSYFILEQESEVLATLQTSYLQLFGQYLAFFEGYTQYLQVPHATIPNLTEFATVAQNIQQYLGTNEDTIITKMDPPMFFFDADSFRALKIIPKLAQALPVKHTTIDWPTTIVNSIEQKSLVQITSGNNTFNSHPVGYFKTDTGAMTNDISQAVGAFMVLEVGQNLYEQELLMEPEWMGSTTGIINILRACLGDLHKLVGLSILDPITETVILHSYNTAKNIPITSTPISQAAEQMITGLQQHRANTTATNATIAAAQKAGTILTATPTPTSSNTSISATSTSNTNTSTAKTSQTKTTTAQKTQAPQPIVLPYASFLPTMPQVLHGSSAPKLVPNLSNIISMLSSSGAAVLPSIQSNSSTSALTKNMPKPIKTNTTGG